MKETLLEKAKHTPLRKTKIATRMTDEHVELAIAWLHGEILLTQLAAAVKTDGIRNNTKGLVTVAYAIKRGIEHGKIKLVVNK
jgi:hypothetical protein